MNKHWTCEEPDIEVLTESALARAQATIQNAIDQAGISRADLARNMERPRSFVTRMLSGSHNLTVKTMAVAVFACGLEIEFGLTPLQWNQLLEEPEQITFEEVPSTEGTLLLVDAAVG